MTRIISWVGAFALVALSAAACGDDDIILPGVPGGSGGAAGGSSGSGGADAGTGGSTAGNGGTPGSAGAGGTGGASGGTGGNAGTGGSAGTGGASSDIPDAGDGDAAVDAGPITPVDAGPCTDPSCVCAVDVITTVPYSEQWQTTDDTEADTVDLPGCQICDNTADHIVTFTPPTTATYRFVATSGGDVELAVYPGDCTAGPSDVSCGEDIDLAGEDYNDELEVELVAGETVTVVVGESCEENGGAGTLTIDLAP